jgi:fructokinase
MTLGGGNFNLEAFCRHWSATHGMKTICVTLGSKCCAVFADDRLVNYEGIKVKVVDTVGAGDAFAAAFLHGFELGWPMERTARFANAVGGLVASRAGATPAWTIDECL